jgi:TolB-like protein/tetratricopeptide (TPR) repeat protein/tRNA A-37 threonylcarbamoyl transferase component Bud32
LADRYAIERELGQGGMATVYLARDRKLGRAVALKVLRPELAAALGTERFLREIEIAAKLAHPHILALHDCGESDGFLYYTMPFVEGESLRDRLLREKQLPLEDALQITRDVADALSYAHSHGLVHRDIKPENILFEAGHAVVSDFGIARAVSTAGTSRLTETGLAVGTPQYMSPEQAAGSQDLDGRSDLYSLGCVLYEMLSGETPYSGPTPQAILAKKLSEPLPRISVVRETVPTGVEAVLAKALARTPADRWVTAADFAAALSRAEAPGSRGTGAQLMGFAKWLVAAGVLVAAVLVVLLATGILRLGAASGGGVRLSSLAVLPLRNLSGDSTQEYVADGMTEAIITELGKISALTVSSRTSSMDYKGKQMPLRAIARELGVQGIVEGSVMREGGQVRITARLIDGRTDRRLWDSTYNRQMAGILALYSEVARTIAGNIGATLTPEEERRLQVVRTVNPQAYDEFLLGRREAMLWTSTGFPRAIVHYRRAIALDSTFADPHAGLVDAYWGLALTGDLSPKASASLAEAAAERAVALDSASARAHLALAQVRTYWQWRLEDADREFLRALELNPGLSDLYVSYVTLLTGLGRHDESVRRALRAVVLDPLQAAAWSQLGWAYFYAGRLQESIAAEDSALRRTPSFPVAHMVRSWAYSALGRHREAVAAVDSALVGDSLYQPVMGSAALVYARAGRPAESRHHLDALLSLGRTKWVDPYNVGWAYAWLGETDRALAAFTRAADELSPSLFGLKVEFLPEAFKADPRYHVLLRRIKLE